MKPSCGNKDLLLHKQSLAEAAVCHHQHVNVTIHGCTEEMADIYSSTGILPILPTCISPFSR
jgi:hypothetical protein